MKFYYDYGCVSLTTIENVVLHLNPTTEILFELGLSSRIFC